MTIFGSGHQVVTSTTRPASPLVGQVIYETDTFSYRWFNGLTWEGVTPVGTVQPFAGATAPSGWLFCDGGKGDGSGGGTLNGSVGQPFADLWAMIGNTYNVAGTQSAFYLPDLRGRAPVGKGANASVTNLGNSDGLANASRSPSHSHTVNSHSHTVDSHAHGPGGYNARWVAGGNIYYANVGGAGNWGTTVYGGVQTIGANAGTLGGGLVVQGSSDAAAPGTNAQSPGTTSAAGSYVTLNYIIKY